MLRKENLVTDYQKRLFAAVVEQLGGDEDELEELLKDVCRGGADAGWTGFIYYRDTCSFYEKHQNDIVRLLENLSDEYRDDAVALVSSFGCFRMSKLPKNTIARALYAPYKMDTNTPADEVDEIANALAWFALEEIARLVTEY